MPPTGWEAQAEKTNGKWKSLDGTFGQRQNEPRGTARVVRLCWGGGEEGCGWAGVVMWGMEER